MAAPPQPDADRVTTPPSPPDAPGSLQSAWISAMPAVFVFLWSTGFIGAKFGLPFAEPFSFLAVRMAVVAVLLILISLAFKAPWPKDSRSVFHVAVAGLLVQGAYLGGVFAAIDAGLSAGMSALITGLQPALTACVVGPLLKERVTPRQWLGVLLGFVGVVLVVANRIEIGAGAWTGIGLATIALFGITAGTLYQKRFCADMDLRSGSAIQFTVTCLAMTGLAFALESREIQWTVELIFAIAWLVVVLSLGAVTLLYILIKRGAAAKVASLFYLVPPVTALMAFFLFDERLGVQELIGMGIVVAGVALITREKA